MEEVLDLAAQLLELGLLDAQERFAQVSHNRLDALGLRRAERRTPVRDQVLEPALRAFPNEHIHRALALLEQPFGQPPPDEAGRAGHEVSHRQLSISVNAPRPS